MTGPTPYRAWIGRREVATDIVTASPAARLAATLDRLDPPPAAGDALPPGWHWLYFLEAVPLRAVGPDGHAARGAFLPPIHLPRRMYAGGSFRFLRPLRIGREVTRISEIADVAVKQGRTGPLAFVTVRHTVFDAEGACVAEEQNLVYRDPPQRGAEAAPERPPAGAEFHRRVTADPVMLFRFSALTFNGHRIHYDQPYATGAEGYAGLVVHGPLLAILLLDLVRREHPDAALDGFSFRAFRPIFACTPFRIAGKRMEDGYLLWADDETGALAMRAEAKVG